jgi:predicted nucleic acid-binding protein
VDEVRVVNASPLIALAKVGRLDLLETPGLRLVVPEPVAQEVSRGEAEDPARVALERGFGAPFEKPPLDPDVLAWSLGAGESAVLAFARAHGGVAVLDDREARVAARVLGVRVTGTLGIVVSAAREKRIDSAADLIHALRSNGLRVDDRVVADALSRYLGESWDPR